MLKKRIRAAGLALAMMASLLAGTATAPAAQAVDCTTTIKIWSFGDVFLPRLILQYKQQNPGICFDIKKSDLDPLNGTNMITACAAANSHTGPDIAAVEIQYSGYWRSYPQCFVDLKTLRRSSDNKNAYDLRGQYLPWRWNNGVAYNGAIIGMPTDVGGLEVAYRWDLLKAKGLPYTRDKLSASITTWDKFIALGQKYMAKLTPAEKAAKLGFMDKEDLEPQLIYVRGADKSLAAVLGGGNLHWAGAYELASDAGAIRIAPTLCGDCVAPPTVPSDPNGLAFAALLLFAPVAAAAFALSRGLAGKS